MKKIYAVKNGRNVGKFYTWDECKKQVDGFSGAIYKSFTSENEADTYLYGTSQDVIKHDESDDNIIVYVDGSYNPVTNECGYAVYITNIDIPKILCGRFPMTYNGRNVEGELRATIEALKYLDHISHTNILIFYDYEGIAKWANNEWSANKSYTKEYKSYIENLRSNNWNIEFSHVYGHTGTIGNEIVDKIAKIACGIELNESDRLFIEQYNSIDGYPHECPQLSINNWY